MKNIHLLRTNLSRLYYSISMSGYNLKLSAIPYHQSSEIRPQHLYITSDEEISGLENNIWVYNNDRVWLWENTMALRSNNKPKKIILTTDTTLIKDGVQAIDDDFLEWFVKNPSCEIVEVERGYLGMGGFVKSNEPISKDKIEYKIIIPKEEPKDVVLGYKTSLDAQMLDKVEPKQETLEEVVNNFKKTDVYINEIKQEQEKMYSEQEVKDLIEDWTKMASGLNQNFPLDKFNIWFEQFKK